MLFMIWHFGVRYSNKNTTWHSTKVTNMLQRRSPKNCRFVPELDDDGPEVTEADNKKEDSVRGTLRHFDDNVEQPVDGRRVG